MLNYKSVLITASFPLFGSVLIISSLTPASLVPILQISPDVLFCFIFIFLIRRPQNVPLVSILFLSLLADFLWHRPLGLSTMTTILASEVVRWAISAKERISVLEEFIYVTLILVLITICQEFLKFLTLIPSLELNHVIYYILFTLLVYLLTTLCIRVIFIS